MARHDGPNRWWQHDATPGVLLIIATLISFALQNSIVTPLFQAILHQPVALQLGPFILSQDLSHFIADGLMAVFFLYVGLELKREVIEGPFKSRQEAALPLIAAIGGIAAPALIFVGLTALADPNYVRGWAVPAATDIAFALGVLALLGSRVPASLRLFLLALAIVDDLGAILIIAFFYSNEIAGWALGGAALTFLAMLGLNRAGLYRLGLYWVLAIVLWGFMAVSGIHATIAGVLAAMAFPMRRPDGRSPLIAAEDELGPWVLLGVMPLFALANAGAPLAGFGADVVLHPITLGVALGLVLGKPLGIFGSAMLAARFLKLKLPASPDVVFGVSVLAGIGFTMSLFISALAFGDSDLSAPSRLGVLIGSGLSAVAGLAILARVLPKQPPKPD
jgi:NhaA family Na+:H+ antiporter